jgi:hypothetical protein
LKIAAVCQLAFVGNARTARLGRTGLIALAHLLVLAQPAQISVMEATTLDVVGCQLVFAGHVKTAQLELTGLTALEHQQVIVRCVKTLAMVITTGGVMAFLQELAGLVITAHLEHTEPIVRAFCLGRAPNAQTLAMAITTQGVVDCLLVRVSYAETARLGCTGVATALGFPLDYVFCVQTLVLVFLTMDVVIFPEVNPSNALIAQWGHTGSTARVYQQGSALRV